MQARVDADFARELTMAQEYDSFYGGQQAPVPEGVTAIWGS